MIYTDLNEILKLDIPENVLSNFKHCYNSLVYYEQDGNCKIGKLVGLKEDSTLYYIINDEYIPVWKSLTKL